MLPFFAAVWDHFSNHRHYLDQNPRKVRSAKVDRHKFGRFFYRFPNGEAGLDVYNRVSSYLGTVARDMKQFRDMGIPMDDCNILMVTHGLTLRLLLMRYF